MSAATRLIHLYNDARANKWYHYFAWFCRIALAVAFTISGFVKISGERFAAGLPVNNPMGHYFEALHQTGYYYTFIGISQVLIAILLLIPRTAVLGALMCFPVVLNICVLTYALRFEGTRATTFMLLASLFLLCWDYNRIKCILPFKQDKLDDNLAKAEPLNGKFPFWFFGSVVAILATVIYLNIIIYDIRPGNSAEECINGCPGNRDPKACAEFCDCIYVKGTSLHDCLAEYEKSSQ